MKNTIKTRKFHRAGQFFMPVLMLAIVSACSSGITVRSDSSPTANFSQYKTYGFFKTLGIESGYNSPIFGELFRAEISKDMEARGYTLAEDPDLLINVTSRYDEKVRVTTYTAPYLTGGYYGGVGGPYYGSAIGAGAAVGTRATLDEEASIFIDLVDNAADKIAWQGVSVVTISDQKAQELEQTINEVVDKIFALYPHTAGN